MLAVVLSGSDQSVVVIGAIGAAGALVGACMAPALELLWNYLRAPTRMLREDVVAIRERVEMSSSKSLDDGAEEHQRALRSAVGNLLEAFEMAERWLAQSVQGLEPNPNHWRDTLFDDWLDVREILAGAGHRAAHDAARTAYLILDGPEDDAEKLRAVRKAIALLNPLLEGSP